MSDTDARSDEPPDDDVARSQDDTPSDSEDGTQEGETQEGATPEAETPVAAETGHGDRKPGRYGLLAGALGIALVALVALSAVFGVQWRQESSQQDHRQAALQAARQTVVNLTTINARTAERDVQQLLDGTTGQFKQQFMARRNAFVQVVKRAGVQTSGQVVAAGLQRFEGDTARALVAARGQVRNSQAPRGVPRAYRVAVDLQRENGQWLTSRLEFLA